MFCRSVYFPFAIANTLRSLDAIIGSPIGYIVSGYWPFRGGPDLRPWIKSIHARERRLDDLALGEYLLSYHWNS
jgi:hypothetical protein